MKLIPLPGGSHTKVDDDECVRLNGWSLSLDKNGYVLAHKRINGKTKSTTLQRLIMNTPKGFETDHINHDRLDNRKINLRILSIYQNRQSRRLGKNNKSGYRGVSWSSRENKWRVYIGFNGKWVSYGSFSDIKEAARIYNKVAQIHHGEFAQLNVV